MKVLITGVAGLLGANFSRYLLQKGYKVVGIDDLSGGYADSVHKDVTFYEQDLWDRVAVENIFSSEKPDYVFHFAAYAAEGLSPFIRNYNYTNNVLSSANVINACVNNNVKKVIFTSSMAVYGVGKPPFTEDQLPTPEDPYGIAKYAVEMDLKLAHEMFGLRYSIVRPHNVVGIYQNIWDRYRNVIGIWIRKAMNNEPLSIFGDGTQVRAFSDIKFYMEPFEKLMTSYDGEIFNIGADKYYTINEAADVVIDVAKELGINAKKVHLEKRNEVHTAYCDHTKAHNLLGFNDQTDLRETVLKMFKWALEQPNRPTKTMDYEIEKNMYSFWKK
ncbi:MAG: NAD-dependent epimerase/dehydratase family protein [Proteobacteria bacterium]|nr:NAD-dependent epimerase/dehydratase family protein [Pseudomonadota bacterium]